jgi:alkanesulfonate monooxygenase SsuD/methylene tetrahydromethanopterin reductase-like flavin-dependent oxidoreductase (luciferase family)
VNVVAAPTAEAAQERFDFSRRRMVRGMLSRTPGAADLTDPEIDYFLTTANGRQIASMMQYAAVGTPDDVRDYLMSFAEEGQADELILAHQSAMIDDRLESVSLTAGALLGVSA